VIRNVDSQATERSIVSSIPYIIPESYTQNL